jgi:hypothetical protein
MNKDRILTIHFIDGSKLSFEFEEQGPNAAAKQIKLQEFLTGKHLIVDSDGGLLIFPITSIKYLALRGPAGAFWKEATLPKGAIRGARIRD